MKAAEASQLSMLLAFRAENTRSFRDELELSMEGTTLSEEGVPMEISWRTAGSPLKVLPAAGIFGANSSGKSNVLLALSEFRSHVTLSFRSGDLSGGMPRRPFLLDSSVATRPTRFEIDLVVGGIRHEYGVEFDDDSVINEWAYRYPRGRAALLFRRARGKPVELGPGNRAIGRAIEKITRPNSLFLSAAAAGSHPDLLPLYQWFE
ncbi:MAG: ATP-binding protein, partial [Nonomuraea sp.]|nr:ATP-binding protein [Nonomuraea sp.]